MSLRRMCILLLLNGMVYKCQLDHVDAFSYLKHCLCFPGGTVVKNLPANSGGHRFEPWSGKIPHAMEQLSPCTTTTEPVL